MTSGLREFNLQNAKFVSGCSWIGQRMQRIKRIIPVTSVSSVHGESVQDESVDSFLPKFSVYCQLPTGYSQLTNRARKKPPAKCGGELPKLFGIGISFRMSPFLLPPKAGSGPKGRMNPNADASERKSVQNPPFVFKIKPTIGKRYYI